MNFIDRFVLSWLIDNPKTVTDVNAFVQYSGMALLDPKMPVEFKVAGPAYVATNVFGVGFLLWYFDPLDKRPHGGLDETWNSGFNPTHEWPSLAWDEASSIPPDEPEYWGDW